MSVFVLLVGLGILGIGTYSFVTSTAVLDDRVEVTAEITDTSVEQVPASRGNTAYVPVVEFQYRYQGTNYTSDRLYPGDAQPQYESEASAESQLAAYPVGETVTAYVAPDAPGEAFLTASRSGLGIGAVAVGVLICVVGGVGLYQARAEARVRDLLS